MSDTSDSTGVSRRSVLQTGTASGAALVAGTALAGTAGGSPQPNFACVSEDLEEVDKVTLNSREGSSVAPPSAVDTSSSPPIFICPAGLSGAMANPNADESPLETAAGAAGPHTTEAFAVLGNETRLAILLALWEAYDPRTEGTAVSFSELREAVGVRQGAQFNYHLDKVVGHFVDKTSDGYELKRAGLQLVQTVIAGTGLEEPSFERTEVDAECTVCGAPTAVTVQDELLYHVCTECGGYFGEQSGRPSGVLSGHELDPAGVSNRTPEEMLLAAVTIGYQTFESAVEGVCHVCSGTMTHSLDICTDHESDGVCDNCGRRPVVISQFLCSVCKAYHQAPPYILVAQHPAVIAFYHERGVPLQYEVTDLAREQQRRRHLKSHEQHLIAEDPPKIRVVVEHDGDELRLTLDEDLKLLEIEEHAGG